MDEMFIPYKEMFPVQSPPKVAPQVTQKESGWNIVLISILVGILFALGFAFYFYYFKREAPPFRQIDAIPFNTIPKQIDIQHVQKKTNVEIPEAKPQAKPEVPEVKPVAPKPKPIKIEPVPEKPVSEKPVSEKSISEKPKAETDTPKAEVPKQEPEKVPDIVEYGNSHELAKGVGTKIRDVLLNHKQIPSLAVASIVSSTVKVLLGENDRPQRGDEDEKKEEPKVEHKVEKKVEQKVEEKKEEDDEPVKDVPRRGKINAETDTNLLKLLKERGLKN